MNTAIEAYELPKLMPTTGGRVEIGIGASALPFCLGFVAIRSLGSLRKRQRDTNDEEVGNQKNL